MSAFGETSDYLNKVKLPIVDTEKCNNLGKELDNKMQFCAGGQKGQVRRKNQIESTSKDIFDLQDMCTGDG